MKYYFQTFEKSQVIVLKWEARQYSLVAGQPTTLRTLIPQTMRSKLNLVNSNVKCDNTSIFDIRYLNLLWESTAFMLRVNSLTSVTNSLFIHLQAGNPYLYSNSVPFTTPFVYYYLLISQISWWGVIWSYTVNHQKEKTIFTTD